MPPRTIKKSVKVEKPKSDEPVDETSKDEFNMEEFNNVKTEEPVKSEKVEKVDSYSSINYASNNKNDTEDFEFSQEDLADFVTKDYDERDITILKNKIYQVYKDFSPELLGVNIVRVKKTKGPNGSTILFPEIENYKGPELAFIYNSLEGYLINGTNDTFFIMFFALIDMYEKLINFTGYLECQGLSMELQRSQNFLKKLKLLRIKYMDYFSSTSIPLEVQVATEVIMTSINISDARKLMRAQKAAELLEEEQEEETTKNPPPEVSLKDQLAKSLIF